MARATFRNRSRYHSRIPVISLSADTGYPRSNASKIAYGRSGVGRSRNAASRRSSSTAARSTAGSYSVDRSAFNSDSSKVRPIAMASPVDFIAVPSVKSVSGNLSIGHRGILVTT
jgi:hypothetical protein